MRLCLKTYTLTTARQRKYQSVDMGTELIDTKLRGKNGHHYQALATGSYRQGKIPGDLGESHVRKVLFAVICSLQNSRSMIKVRRYYCTVNTVVQLPV